jgi:hypothetical protein
MNDQGGATWLPAYAGAACPLSFARHTDRRPRSGNLRHILSKLGSFDMALVRGGIFVFLLALACLLGITLVARADVSGICSCRSATCHGRWEVRATNMAALRAECHAKVGDHGFLSKMHRMH